MEHKHLNDGESFKAWGVGLHYEHDAETKIIEIINAHTQKPVLYVDSSSIHKKYSLNFTHDICKISQLYALTFSQNKTIDICETLEGPQLKAVMKQITLSARRSYNLKRKKFKSFNENLGAALNKDQRILIRRSKACKNSPALFTACYWNCCQDKAIKLQNTNLSKLLYALSSHLSQTITTQHIMQSNEQCATQSLNLAQDLLILSLSLSQEIQPKDFLKSSKDIENQIVKKIFA